jgi:hypothetical protein
MHLANVVGGNAIDGKPARCEAIPSWVQHQQMWFVASAGKFLSNWQPTATRAGIAKA